MDGYNKGKKYSTSISKYDNVTEIQITFTETIPKGMYIARLKTDYSNNASSTAGLKENQNDPSLNYFLKTNTTSPDNLAVSFIFEITQETNTLYLTGYASGYANTRTWYIELTAI